ncbi:MAG: hypothetical protein J07HX64_02777 [halophilic archaeon J07HX64]|nr:MAG: hypothetical protein J07HX64_02777 [halophilic archaeon J07HX64]
MLPRKPYDEGQSEFIRGEIRRGSFDDLEHRRAVNQPVWLEWYATGGDTAPGSFGSAVTNWRLAAVHLDAFDIVRREFGAPTRDSIRLEGEFACSVETPPVSRLWTRRRRLRLPGRGSSTTERLDALGGRRRPVVCRDDDTDAWIERTHEHLEQQGPPRLPHVVTEFERRWTVNQLVESVCGPV